MVSSFNPEQPPKPGATSPPQHEHGLQDSLLPSLIATGAVSSIGADELLLIGEDFAEKFQTQVHGVVNDLFSPHSHGFNSHKPLCNATSEPAAHKGAFMYIMTSFGYADLLKASVCSLRVHNPNAHVAVGIVLEYFGEKADEIILWILDELGADSIVMFPKLEFASAHTSRFTMNWLKLRLWQLEDVYESIVFLDADTLVGGNLMHLFDLPFRFGATLDMDKGQCTFEKFQSGVFFLRPCRSHFLHMIALLNNNPWLAFPGDHAEQSFLDWYYFYDRAVLPASFHVIEVALKSNRMMTFGSPKSYRSNVPIPSDQFVRRVQVLHLVQKRILDPQLSAVVKPMLGQCINIVKK
jgi:hypothetical protein